MKIVVLDGYTVNPGDIDWGELEKLGDVTIYSRTEPKQVEERAADADAILTNKVVLMKKQLDSMPNLKYIGVLATGYNVVDLNESKRRGIVVTNIPAYSTDSVAQMTFAHILNIINKVGYYAQQNSAGRWTQNPDFCYWDAPLHELAAMTLGIVGLGNIGAKVARIASAFGMNVLAFTSKDQSSLPEGIQKCSVESLFANSDIITLHCPLKDDTRHLVRHETIAKMKHGVIVVNTGRGPLVCEDDVAQALHEGKIAAYGADVLDGEPPSADNPLLHAPNAFITPHIAWATTEARKRLVGIAVDNLRLFLQGCTQNQVNN